jgi:site-specific DNA-methyltransferase (adenine-specific)
MKYNPQGLLPFNKIVKGNKNSNGDLEGQHYGRPSQLNDYLQEFTNYPTTVLNVASEGKTIHPTQKPVQLFEYLIKTYSDENDLVLDNCLGSGTTAIAAINTKRNFIGIEKDKKYFDLSEERIKNHLKTYL